MATPFESQQPTEYFGQDSFFKGSSPLPESVGYAVVLGFGAAFSIFTTILVFLEKKFAGGASITSEKFK
jgi:hypothetical protein